MKPRSLKAQIAEVAREIGLRKKVYPNLVTSRKMSHGEAEEYMTLMENVMATLQFLDRHAEAMRPLWEQDMKEGKI